MKFVSVVTAKAVLLLGLGSTTVVADVPTGLSVYGQGIASSSATESIIVNDDTTTSRVGLGASDTTFGVGADYGFGDGTKSVFRVGVEYQGKTDAGIFETSTIEDEARWSVYVAPGMVIGQSLFYARLGVTYGETLLSDPEDAFSRKYDTDGTFYGVGVRSYFDDGVFVDVSFDRAQLDTIRGPELGAASRFEPEVTSGRIAIGVTF
jgi:hypothetical protein